MTARVVRCQIHGRREAYGSYVEEFVLGRDVEPAVTGRLGPEGLSPEAADLADVGVAVYHLERLVRGRQRTNRPRRFDISLPVRRPEVWTPLARAALAEALGILGGAEWRITFRKAAAATPDHDCDPSSTVDRVVLFSGGLDSACGAAVEQHSPTRTRFMSFYTRQKRQQCKVADLLGIDELIQWHMRRHVAPGRGKSFRYRSFMFVCLALATASSYGARTVVQYENGVLASAIPPAPGWFMTRHAHPQFHAYMCTIASAVLGDAWSIENPFALQTKGQCVQLARKHLGDQTLDRVTAATETCWFLWSNRTPGGRKRPGLPCGVCISCIVRLTALPHETCKWSLDADAVRNHDIRGRAFRAYHGFLNELIMAGASAGQFYNAIPAAARELVIRGDVRLDNLRSLFGVFAEEFALAFK